jgi:hypothetical protein
MIYDFQLQKLASVEQNIRNIKNPMPDSFRMPDFVAKL